MAQKYFLKEHNKENPHIRLDLTGIIPLNKGKNFQNTPNH